MHYFSTRGNSERLPFGDAILMGLARDGGLLLPETIPDIHGKLDVWRGLNYVELAVEVMGLFCDVPREVLADLVDRSYGTFDVDEVVPIVPVGDLFVMELFHGPTLAFKDVALQFLGNLFEYLLDQTGQHLNIVAATSGDTGSAAIQGVRGKARINIFVMHPKGRTSRTQELQMTTVRDPNVHNLAVAGTFDDCQAMLKKLFSDLALKDAYSLGAVNSINWARVLAQIVYYVYGALRITTQTGAKAVQFTVPTGNFGNVFAGYVAMRMGAPIARLVLATNENNILERFFTTGEYRVGKVVPTCSPSMDIQVASNFERYLYYRADGDTARVREWMERFQEEGLLRMELAPDGRVDTVIVAGCGTRDATLATIRRCYQEHDYLLDPHTAVGMSVCKEHQLDGVPMICLATAHPAKFREAICEALGEDLAHHPTLDALEGLPVLCHDLPAETQALRNYLCAALSGEQ
jgi:threonine synthase